jgi:hypothetical protein
MAKKRSWALIIISVGAFLLIVGGGTLAVVGYYISQQFSLQSDPTMTAEAAGRSVAEVRARFKGQVPFIEIGAEGDPVVHRELEGTTRHTLSALRMVVWDGGRRRGFVQLKMPFWVVSLGSSRNIRVSRPDGGDIELRVTAEDLERRGPALILDRTDDRGRQILVWTE